MRRSSKPSPRPPRRPIAGQRCADESGDSPDLQAVVKEIAALVKSYMQRKVRGDRYSAGWVRQAFEAERITYKESKA